MVVVDRIVLCVATPMLGKHPIDLHPIASSHPCLGKEVPDGTDELDPGSILTTNAISGFASSSEVLFW